MDLNRNQRVLLARLELTFEYERLFLQALTHRSFAEAQGGTIDDSYERLEEMGDVWLEAALRQWLIDEHRNHDRRGVMRGFFASNYHLATAIARPLGVYDCILITDGARPSPGQRYKLEADVIEAIIGAVEKDQGMVAAVSFARRLTVPSMEKAVRTGLYDPIKLLEKHTRRQYRRDPVFRDVTPGKKKQLNGFQHAITVEVNGRTILGLGHRRRIAQLNAARNALADVFTVELHDMELYEDDDTQEYVFEQQ